MTVEKFVRQLASVPPDSREARLVIKEAYAAGCHEQVLDRLEGLCHFTVRTILDDCIRHGEPDLNRK